MSEHGHVFECTRPCASCIQSVFKCWVRPLRRWREWRGRQQRGHREGAQQQQRGRGERCGQRGEEQRRWERCRGRAEEGRGRDLRQFERLRQRRRVVTDCHQRGIQRYIHMYYVYTQLKSYNIHWVCIQNFSYYFLHCFRISSWNSDNAHNSVITFQNIPLTAITYAWQNP